jgi:large subunit ribosomal protein L25
VEVICDNEKSIPHAINIDVGALQVTQKVRAHDLVLPAGTKLAKKTNFLIASITGRGKAEEEVAPVAGAPAAGAAAAPAAAGAPAKAAAKAPAKDEKKSDKK